MFQLRPKQASMVWLDSHHVHAGGTTRALNALEDEARLASLLTELPAGPTKWVVDDLWAPSILLRDVVEVPPGIEARESYFKWRFTQGLALDEAQSVQALSLGEGTWLLAGLPQDRREAWIQMALRLGRPIHALVPRWLWLYNRLAPVQEAPGALISLSADGLGQYTGTLAAWGRNLALLRQWSDPAPLDAWMTERVLPSVAFLQRDGRPPQQLWVWGAPSWPEGPLMTHLLQPEIPAQETL